MTCERCDKEAGAKTSGKMIREPTGREEAEAYLAELTEWLDTHGRTASHRMIIATEREQRLCREWLGLAPTEG